MKKLLSLTVCLLLLWVMAVAQAADVKISNMTPGGTIQTTDQIPIARPANPGVNYQVQIGTAGTLGIGSGLVAIGTNLAFQNPMASLLGINLNSASLPAAQTGTILQLGGANATASRAEVDSFGASSYFSGVRRDGTNASPSALLSGDEIGGFNAFGYNGTGVVGPRASIRTFANQNWTTGNNGTYVDIATTPNNTTSLAGVARFENDGGITVPSGVTGGDKGPGTINASGLFVNGVAVGTSGGGGSVSLTGTGPIVATPTTITGTGAFSCPTCGVTGSGLNQFASTTSAQLAAIISDETGTGASVFAGSPTLTGTPNIAAATGTSLAVSGNITSSGGSLGIGTATPRAGVDFGAKTDAALLPSGTTGQRPGTPVNGEIRYNTTTNQVEVYGGASPSWASIAGGGSVPGGSQYQMQFNAGSSTLGGINDFFPVDAYGAVCDGKIFYVGVHTTNGSPNISVPANSADGYPGYAFTSADVGKTVTISNPAQANSSSPPSTTITTTIASISGTGAGNTAVLATNMTFTSSSYQYASLRMYATDNKTAIQAAYNAAAANGGGWVIFPPGVCATSGPIIFNNGTRMTGQSNGSSVLMLTNGSNSDLLQGANFSTLTGTNSYGGVRDWSIENLQLDGNKMANTGSGSGTGSGWGNGVRVYGMEFTTFNVLINYFASDGWYSEWTTGAGSPAESPDGMEANPHDIKLFANAGYGMVWNGPHDSKISYMYMSENGTAGFLNGPSGNGSPVSIEHSHGYVNGTTGAQWDYVINVPYFSCTDCFAEGGVLLSSFSAGFTQSGIGISTGNSGLKFSCSAGGSYFNSFSATSVNNITNSGSCATGNDYWGDNSSVAGTITSYSPSGTTLGSSGFGSVQVGNSAQLSLTNGSAWPVKLFTTSVSLFTLQNGGVNALTVDANQKVAMGPNAVAAQSGAGLDLSADNSSANSSVILPVGTTAARPSTGIEGMLRYNSTSHSFEGYSGSSPAWGALGAGGSSTVSLGTATATNPQISGDSTSGLYTAGAAKVDVGISSSKVAEFTSSGEAITGVLTVSSTLNVTGASTLTGAVTLGNVTGSTQCLHANSSGVISGTGSDCGSSGGGAVNNVSGDGVLINNVNTTGAVVLTLGNATAKSLWGNNTSGAAAPSYQTSPVVSGSITAATHIPTSSTPPTDGVYLPAANTTGIADGSQPVLETIGMGTTAVDYLTITNAATATLAKPQIAVAGTDTNIALPLLTKGNGYVMVGTTTPQATATGTEMYVEGQTSDNSAPIIVDQHDTYPNGGCGVQFDLNNTNYGCLGGTDYGSGHFKLATNSGFFEAAGATGYVFGSSGYANTPTGLFSVNNTNNNPLFEISVTSNSSVDYANLSGSVTGNPGSATITAAGSDTNVSLVLSSKGSGVVQLAGHLGFSQAALPGVSTGTVTTGSTDNKGQITGLSAATSETITFSSALPTAPACSIIGSAAIVNPIISSISTSAVTFGFNSYTGSLYYVCF